jgi:hypothetical protein
MPSKKRPGRTKPTAARRATARKKSTKPPTQGEWPLRERKSQHHDPRALGRGTSGGARWKPGDPPRKKKPARVLTAAQSKRLELLRENGKDITSVAEYLTAHGYPCTRQHVSDVIHTKWKFWHTNDRVIDGFCAVTHSTRASAWPDLPSQPNAVNAARTAYTGTEG